MSDYYLEKAERDEARAEVARLAERVGECLDVLRAAEGALENIEGRTSCHHKEGVMMPRCPCCNARHALAEISPVLTAHSAGKG